MRTWIACLALLTVGLGTSAAPVADSVLPLRILYVGTGGSPRARDFESFLKKYFAQVSAADRASFDPAIARSADVVLLDWSQADQDARQGKSPLGQRENWSRPTVLLDSAGLLLAGPWQFIGKAG
jgi:hypothetical protein